MYISVRSTPPTHTNIPRGCMYVHTEAYMQCDMCVYIHTYPFTHTHTTVYNRVYTCADMSTNTHIHLHIYTYANVKYKDLFQGRLRCRWMWRGCGWGVDLQLQLPFDPSLGTFVCGRCSPKKKKKPKEQHLFQGIGSHVYGAGECQDCRAGGSRLEERPREELL